MITKYLANKRYKIADRLIDDELRDGYLLDLGCGLYHKPILNMKFKYKVGVDDLIYSTNLDWDENNPLFVASSIEDYLPDQFDKSWDVITMLAVIEHLETSDIPMVLKHIYRILKLNGQFILTTPHPRANIVFKLQKFGRGHIKLYNKLELIHLLGEAGFYAIGYGTFELGFNQYCVTSRYSGRKI